MGRPEKLYVIRLRAMNGPHDYREATIDEVLSWVRRGVESGTIKGEEVDYCVEHGCTVVVQRHCEHFRYLLATTDPWEGKPTACRIEASLVIGPVSDGRSET